MSPTPAAAAAAAAAVSKASALRLAQLRVADSHVPDALSFGMLIQHCTDHGLFRLGRLLHGRLVLLSVVPDNFLGSKIISMYARFGHLHEAQWAFEAIPIKNLFSWNAMLLAYSVNDQVCSTLRLFYSFPSSSFLPDAFTLSCLLKSISSSSFSSSANLITASGIHSFAIRLRYDSDLFVSNGLITVYGRSGDVNSARKIFDEMPTRDVVSWNSIISCYSQEGYYDDCLKLYKDMEVGMGGVMPNGVTVASVLRACSQVKDLIFGMAIHSFAVDIGIEADAVVYNSILGLYASCGSLDYARYVFDNMINKDVVSYNTLISGYMTYGFVNQAMELFHQTPTPVLATWNAVIGGLAQNKHFSCVLELFRAMQTAAFRPNSVTLSSVLPAVSFYSNLLSGKQIHCYAIRNHCDENVYVATALIDAYAKAGFLPGACRVFEESNARSLIVWTAIISAHAAHGNVVAALSVFHQMLETKVQPDPVTFTAVLSACAHAGEVDEARRVVNVLMPEFGISPAAEHYACMIGALSRKGMLKEAVEVIDRMPFQPNAKAWGALLNGAAVYRDVELGKYAFERLFKMEPNNTGNFVVMANLYSQAGRWKEAQWMRDKMKGVGLAKVPGCSWVEGTSDLHVFITQDATNKQYKDLPALLDGLVRLMREEGYVAREEVDEE
ncbi:hypothetical protein HPP92_025064 [Vanilla planifolia]|uniref:Pentatricopeptide repeat-containing protein n=1 Tax=Vanilla planifolia TaxID=51239 RepID=A0A835PHA6_VANPL|nr:hypothetical protein HPP92_025064 [Vanilla planifolia]